MKRTSVSILTSFLENELSCPVCGNVELIKPLEASVAAYKNHHLSVESAIL